MVQVMSIYTIFAARTAIVYWLLRRIGKFMQTVVKFMACTGV